MKTQQIVEKQHIEKRVRGGTWVAVAVYHRCAFHFSSDPDPRHDHLGFRVVSPSFRKVKDENTPNR